MKNRVSTEWAALNLDQCLAQIRRDGDGFVLYENNKPVAELVPPANGHRTTLRELCNALAAVPVDEDFASDLQLVNTADRPLDNPWDSSSTPPH